MVWSKHQQLTWADDGADDEHTYSIPQLIDPRNLVENEKDQEAVECLEAEREELINEVLKLNSKLRFLATRYKDWKKYVCSQQNEKSDIVDSLTLAIMNAEAVDVDLFLGRESPTNAQRNNEFQRLSTYLLGSSQESRYRPFVRGDSTENFEHKYSFGQTVKVFKKPGQGHTNETPNLVPSINRWGGLGECATVVGENETDLQVLFGTYYDNKMQLFDHSPYWLSKQSVAMRREQACKNEQ